MDTPALIEQHFRVVMHAMQRPGSPSAHALRGGQFLRPLLDGNHQLDPYLPETVETIVGLLPQASFIGTDPRLLDDLFRLLTLAQLRCPAIATLSGLERGIATLRGAAALQYAFAGEPGKALELLIDTGERAGTAPHVEFFGNGSLLNRYRAVDTEGNSKEAPRLGQWETLLDRWQTLIGGTRDAVVVPVVEEHHGSPDFVTGGLRTIRFSTFTFSKDGAEHVHTNVGLAGIHNSVASTFSPPIRAAFSCSEMHSAAATSHHLHVHIEFEGEHNLHSGESANLAIAALARCSLLRLMGRREAFSVEQSVAITGGIDASGCVLPVSPDSLASKVSATFFSWIEYLVVPLEQLEPAKEALRACQERYPRRHLHLIGVTHLREVLFDRRLTRITKRNLLGHAAHRLWSHRRPAAVVVLSLLLLIIARLWYGPLDKHPAGWSTSDNNIVIFNSSGAVIDRIYIGQVTSLEAANDPGVGRNIAALLDCDGDGVKEIVWAQSSDTRIDDPSMVFCKGVGESEPRWHMSLQRRLSFPRRPDIRGEGFRWFRVEAGDYDNDGRPEVYVLGKNMGFPSLVMKLDGATGQELGTYIHAGHLNDMRTMDLNGDGTREILLCGVNNSLGSASLVVLDPCRIDGYSPHAPVDMLDSVPRAREYAYLLIPRTIVGEAFRKQVKYNIGESVQVHDAEALFTITVRDAFVTAVQHTERLSSTILPLFNHDLRLVSMQTGDDFDALYEYLVETRQIASVPRMDYVQEYVRAFGTHHQPIPPQSVLR